ncbi:MAG: hypothetical protein ACR2NP_13445 [Pirellulaceae bacterium]
MTRLRLFKLGLAIGLLFQLTMVCQTSHADLTKRQLRTLEYEFLPAYYRGDTLGVLESLGQVVGRLSNDDVAQLDEMLAGQDIPAASNLLVEARLKLLQQNPDARLPKPALRELLLMLEHIDGETSSLLEESAAIGLAIDELKGNESFDEYEALLWDAHVLEQRLGASKDVAAYAVQLLKAKRRYRTDDLEQAENDLLNLDFGQRGEQLASELQQLSQRELLVRIARIKHARNVLKESDDLEQHYHAAWSIRMDGELTDQQLKQRSDWQLAALQDENLPDQVAALVSEGRELAGEELLEKSRLLFTGMHWWIRGRYGMGTDGYGLLKSPAALTSEEDRFALFMPETTPQPTDPRETSRYQIPEVDRRHNYIWAWEYRQVQMSTNVDREVIGRSRQVTTETQLSRFY